MATHNPISICGNFRYFFGICGVILATISIVIGFEEIATARPGVSASIEIVNRTRKADRLPLIQINVPRAPSYDSKLPDGCDSLVSSLTRSHLAHVAGRCVS
jgi:hypothetical protein